MTPGRKVLFLTIRISWIDARVSAFILSVSEKSECVLQQRRVRVVSLSERLRQVREAMRLTLEDVSQRTGLGLSTLSEFENGRREPRLGQLKRLAESYHRPISYFLEEASSSSDLVLWRERPTSPMAEQLQARLIELADQYRTLEVLCKQPSQLELPWEKGDPSRYGYPEAGRLARHVRNVLGLGERPGQAILRVLEEVCSVRVFHLDFEPGGSAACTVADRYGAAILLNARNVPWRRNFDLAHELFHLLTWRVFRQGDSGDSAIPSQSEEKLATCFARNLLMPEEVFRSAVEAQRGMSRTLGFDGLFEVAREFDVSIEAVLWQMGFVYKILPEEIKDYLERMHHRMGYWDRRDRDTPPERPLRFLALARQALRKGLISTGRYAQYIGVTRREAMKVVEEDAEDDAEIEVTHS